MVFHLLVLRISPPKSILSCFTRSSTLISRYQAQWGTSFWRIKDSSNSIVEKFGLNLGSHSSANLAKWRATVHWSYFVTMRLNVDLWTLLYSLCLRREATSTNTNCWVSPTTSWRSSPFIVSAIHLKSSPNFNSSAMSSTFMIGISSLSSF